MWTWIYQPNWGLINTVMEALAGPSLQSLLAEIQHRGGPVPDET